MDQAEQHLSMSARHVLLKQYGDLPVPSAGTLLPPGSPMTELSDSLLRAILWKLFLICLNRLVDWKRAASGRLLRLLQPISRIEQKVK